MFINLYLIINIISFIISSPSLPEGLKLVFEDQFDNGYLNRDLWEVEVACDGGGNLEQQCYVDHPEVLNIADNKLNIIPKYIDGEYKLKQSEFCTSKLVNGCDQGLQLPIISGKIKTKLSNPFGYGRFEIRAKLPIGNYLWPTFWLLPTTNKYGSWPSGGEIDIMESKGHIQNIYETTIHHGGNWPNNSYRTTPINRPGLSNDFNTYGVDYDKNSIRFYFNDEYINTINISDTDFSTPSHNYNKKGLPFVDQQWYLILDLAVAGNYFGPGWKFDKYNDPKTWSQSFSIDHVRVYQY